jgi:hypothetical protein
VNKEKLVELAKNHKLVEAVFIEAHIIYLVVAQHSEDAYETASVIDQRLGYDEADIRVRAHQGRGVDSLGLERWAKRLL